MSYSKQLNTIKKLINYARGLELKRSQTENQIFELLNDMGIDTSTKTNAENADDLQEAICCHISYGEYSVDGIIEEIKAQGKQGEHR